MLKVLVLSNETEEPMLDSLDERGTVSSDSSKELEKRTLDSNPFPPKRPQEPRIRTTNIVLSSLPIALRHYKS